MREHFGGLLRAARKKADKTMEDLAKKLGLTVSYVSDVERGYRQPWTNERIVEIAEFLNTDPNPLLKAAAESRGAFVLSADVTAAGREAGASLMRVWNELSDEDFVELEKLANARSRSKTGGNK
jgi:transcriptional regulator with XRE-family HTH domain